MPDFATEKTTAQFVVLLLEKIWGLHQVAPNTPPPGRIPSENPETYLTAAQAEALAAEGVRLLAHYLPQESAQRVTSAVEHLPRPRHASHEQVLLRLGALGAVLPHGGDPNSPPGCCVFWPGRGMVCVR